jgi:hypothetical protein
MEYTKKEKLIAFSVALLPEVVALFLLFLFFEVGHQLYIKFGSGDPRLSLLFISFGSGLSILILIYKVLVFYIKNGWSFSVKKKS